MQSKYEKVILVTGATGKQGGATARHLLKSGWQVRALTRNPGSQAARALSDLGAQVTAGTLDDRESVQRAMAGCYGVYSVQSLEEGIDGEIRQGKMLADEAQNAGILHFVYSSVGGADRNTGIPHFESKWQIEQHIRSLGLLYTILRPVFFMENFLMPQIINSIVNGQLSLPMKPDKTLAMVAVDDIGVFVEMAFDDPDKFISQSIELAGDEITMPRAAELFGRVLQREVKFTEMPIEQMRKISEDYAVMYQWFNDYGYKPDIPTLKSMYLDLKNFETWLHTQNLQQYAAQATAAGKR